MAISRLRIFYRPALYSELIARAFRAFDCLEVIERPSAGASCPAPLPPTVEVEEVILVSLDECGQPDLHLLPEPSPEAKLLAFSPTGDYGLRRLPGRPEWEELRPFGLEELMVEVLGEYYPDEVEASGLPEPAITAGNSHRTRH